MKGRSDGGIPRKSLCVYWELELLRGLKNRGWGGRFAPVIGREWQVTEINRWCIVWKKKPTVLLNCTTFFILFMFYFSLNLKSKTCAEGFLNEHWCSNEVLQNGEMLLLVLTIFDILTCTWHFIPWWWTLLLLKTSVIIPVNIKVVKYTDIQTDTSLISGEMPIYSCSKMVQVLPKTCI